MEEADLQLIDQYLNGELSDEDREFLDNRIQNEPNFVQQIKLIQDIAEANLMDTDDFRSLLETVAQDYKSKQGTPIPIRRKIIRLMGIAASVLLIATLSFLVLNQIKKANSPQDLYAANFEPYLNNITTRNLGTTDLETAMGFYDREQYAEAVEALEKLILMTPSDTLLFYGGISNLVENQLSKAQEKLQSVASNSSSIYQAQAQWYLALAYLRETKKEQAISTLQELSRSTQSSTYASKGKTLLKQLN